MHKFSPLVWMLLVGLYPGLLVAQQTDRMKEVLDRLDRLENENRSLREEMQAMRKEMAEAKNPKSNAEPPVDERVAVQDQRIDDLAQTKVEASHKFPLQLTGMALFNAFTNTQNNGGWENPVTASLTPGPRTSGASLRQTVLGLVYDGPASVAGAKVSGSFYMDFAGGYGGDVDHTLRIRTAAINLDWGNRSLMVGQDKPLIAPREPDSLAQVGVSPLTGAGNLWYWQPQARFEQRFRVGDLASVRAQASVYETAEGSSNAAYAFTRSLERSRPGYEGRLEFTHSLDDHRRLEIAPGFHFSTTHVAGYSVPSHIFSMDWFANPWAKLEFTGAFFNGENVAGLGSLRQGFTGLTSGEVIPIHATGGWAQFAFLATSRLTFHAYAGEEADRNADLLFSNISKNQSYGANAMYRLAPNVIVSFEATQLRTTYLGIGTRLHNHYDLALAYMF